MVDDPEPTAQNNRYKLPLYRFGVVSAVVLLAAGIVTGALIFELVGAIGLVSGLAGLFGTRGGRNPWWTRAPLDYRRRR